MNGLLFRTLTALLPAVGLAASLAAQEPWKASYYPYVLKGPNDKASLVLHYQYGRAANYEDRVPFDGSISLEGGANADGSHFLVGRFKAPGLVRNWRFFSEAGYVRENRFGYFGLGNDAEMADPPPEYVNRVGRTRTFVRGEVTRRLVGRLQVSVAAGFTDASYRPLPGGSQFADDYLVIPPCLPPGGCPAPPGDPSDTDFTGRLSLILDTRDSEYLTTRGAFVEAGWLGGTGGDGYSGWYGIARGYVSPWFGGVVAARVAARSLSGGAPLDARYSLSSWERDIPVLGGPESHRSFVYGRFAGVDALFGNLELRQTVIDFADFGAVGAIAFLDAGRVEEGTPGESKALHVGGGGGLWLRILRSTVLSLNFAGGGDGFRFSMGTGWTF